MMVGLLGPRQSYGGLFADPRLNTGIGQASAMINAIPERQMPAMPQRERVNPLRVLDRVLGGQTISGGLDAERERLQAEAMRPQMEAQRAMEAAQIAQLPVDLQIAFRADPAAAARALAARQTPMAAAAGTAIVTPGDPSSAFYNERREILGDNVVGMGVPGQDPRVLFNAPESRDQALARQKAAQDFQIAEGRLAVDRQTANRPQLANIAPNAQLLAVDPTGQASVIGENQNLTPGEEAANLRRAEIQDKERATAQANLATIANTRSAVNRAIDQVGFLSAGALTAGLPFNQPRENLKATIDTIQANLSFAELAQMRANSPTGGALGSIAVRELDLLGSTVASLNPNQSQAELRRSLQTIDESMKRWEDAVRRSQEARQGQGGSAPAGRPNISREAAIAEARRRGLIP